MHNLSTDSGKVYNLLSQSECSIHYADNDLWSGDITVTGDGLTALPPGQVIMSAAILANCDTAAAAGVGWVSIRHRTPAKPANSHTAISANLLLCANNSADVLAFWKSFALFPLPTPRACLVCVMPHAASRSLAFPITEGTVKLKSAGVLLLTPEKTV